MPDQDLSDNDYQLLLRFRTDLRRFVRWSEEEARAEGFTLAQHQLLLAIRGHAGPGAPTVNDVADALLLRHHSATGLVDRAEAAGFVQRTRDREDHRAVRLSITRAGAARLARLSRRHLEELDRLRRGIFGGAPSGGVS
jgi:DNA-binding MarR family transcriptional regulator